MSAETLEIKCVVCRQRDGVALLYVCDSAGTLVATLRVCDHCPPLIEFGLQLLHEEQSIRLASNKSVNSNSQRKGDLN